MSLPNNHLPNHPLDEANSDSSSEVSSDEVVQSISLEEALPPNKTMLMDLVHQHLGQRTGQLSRSQASDQQEKDENPANKKFHIHPGYNRSDLEEVLLPEGSIAFLNGSDRELSSGLEHLLPTPATRYRVSLKRLNKEMKQLEKKIQLYQSLKPLPETLRPLVKAMTRRQTIMNNQYRRLEARLAVIDRSPLNTLVNSAKQCFQIAEITFNQALRYLDVGIKTVTGVFQGTEKMQGKRRLGELFAEMKAVKTVMTDIKRYHPNQMAVYYTLLSRYETKLAEVERLKRVLEN